MDVKQTLQYCRQRAKAVGQTLRVHEKLKISNAPNYYYVNRSTGEVIVFKCHCPRRLNTLAIIAI